MAQTLSGQWHEPMPGANGDIRPSARQQSSREHSQTRGARRTPSDAWNIMSDSEETKVRRQSLKATNSTATRKRSRNTLREKTKTKPEEAVDDSAWIHRDKLAEIEIQEMAEAGIDVRPYRRSVSAGPGASARSSRSQSRSRRPSRDKAADLHAGMENGGGFGEYDESGRKRISTIPAADEEEQEFDPRIDAELRTPEEVAVERTFAATNHTIRPSTSRIPISKASPVPVPANVVERDSPLPRSRGNSNAWSGNPNWDDMQYARRARSNSIGSQALLDDEGVQTPPRPGSSHLASAGDNSSPSKGRVPQKSTPTSGARNTSTANGSLSGRPRNSSTKENRPVSRGHQSRPSTSSRAPEGEAPWIATMYKPDPRLPPDQQMLPTHAKRMMQDQWEKEGKSGTAFDRDLRPLNDTALPVQPPEKYKPLPSPPDRISVANGLGADFGYLRAKSHGSHDHTAGGTSPSSPDGNAWPLTPKSDNAPSSRPGTSGGYKITPTIATPPPLIKSPSMAQGHNATPRIPDPDEKDERQSEKNGGCGCCVVM